MAERTKDPFFPIEWERWDPLDTASFLFMNCKITEDFGPLKAGEEFDSIVFDIEESVCVVQTKDGDELHKFRIRCS